MMYHALAAGITGAIFFGVSHLDTGATRYHVD